MSSLSREKSEAVSPESVIASLRSIEASLKLGGADDSPESVSASGSTPSSLLAAPRRK
jgi:hypothetical protein